jgi:hypothetical protein
MRRTHLYGIFRVLILGGLAGCGASSEDSSPMPSPATSAGFAFVNNRDINSISVFRVDPATGQLSSITAVPTGTCLAPRYSELYSPGRLLFVSCATSDTVASFSINPSTGDLKMVGSLSPRERPLDIRSCIRMESFCTSRTPFPRRSAPTGSPPMERCRRSRGRRSRPERRPIGSRSTTRALSCTSPIATPTTCRLMR